MAVKISELVTTRTVGTDDYLVIDDGVQTRKILVSDVLSLIQIESSRSATPTSSQQAITPTTGYDAMAQVIVNAVPYEETDNSAGGKTVTIL